MMASMLKIRLQRVGRRNIPSFRVVLTDSKNSTKSGRVLEVLGFHDPVGKKTEIDGDRVKHWLSVGAKATDTMHNLLISRKLISGKKINVLPKKSPIAKEGEEKPEEQAAPSPEAESKEENSEVNPEESQSKEEAEPEAEKEEPKEEPKSEDESKKEEQAS
ncbi:MAG: 30S ribosomal protein S16 [Parcubacteria group bacterium CG11_big_fil_rev_8_21_14_0_20_39_22]|nr:MAG: 30S ribosomal protein S16 [Parcubacteria group bacterium CG11_big_fil_rev_8_21_14_0_20_39_22]